MSSSVAKTSGTTVHALCFLDLNSEDDTLTLLSDLEGRGADIIAETYVHGTGKNKRLLTGDASDTAVSESLPSNISLFLPVTWTRTSQ